MLVRPGATITIEREDAEDTLKKITAAYKDLASLAKTEPLPLAVFLALDPPRPFFLETVDRALHNSFHQLFKHKCATVENLCVHLKQLTTLELASHNKLHFERQVCTENHPV